MRNAISGKKIRRTSPNRYSSKRCQEEGCNKKARDYYEGRTLCRVHSPMRLGYLRLMKGGNK